jgi:hypothetical protein
MPFLNDLPVYFEPKIGVRSSSGDRHSSTELLTQSAKQMWYPQLSKKLTEPLAGVAIKVTSTFFTS